MLEIFFPNLYLKSIYSLPLEKLKAQNIDTLFFDVDNTLAPYDIPEADDSLFEYLNSLKLKGFKVGIISNNSKKRVSAFNRRLNIYAVHRACKPIPLKLEGAISRIGAAKKNTAIIGDQIFTDIFCGKLAGIYTILIKPISQKDQFVTKIKRGLENRVIKEYLKKENLNE